MAYAARLCADPLIVIRKCSRIAASSQLSTSDELNFTRTVHPDATIVPSAVGQSYAKIVAGERQVTDRSSVVKCSVASAPSRFVEELTSSSLTRIVAVPPVGMLKYEKRHSFGYALVMPSVGVTE